MIQARTFVRWGVSAVLSWLVLCTAIGIVSVEGALHPRRRSLVFADELRAKAIADRNHAALTDNSIVADDGVILRGWMIRPAAGGDEVILLHGQGDNRAGMLGPADMLLRHGYTVLLPDARAHGQSGGAVATYGVKEASDIRRWYEWLRRSTPSGCIDGLGDSMGAAQLLNSLSVESNFCAVVAESSFATFQEAAYVRIGQQFNTGPWLGRSLLRPVSWVGLLYAKMRYGVALNLASPEHAVAESRVPILLIHGLADTNLPPRHSEMIKSSNPAVVLWEPRNVGHCEASTVEPAEYKARVLNWFESHHSPTVASNSR